MDKPGSRYRVVVIGASLGGPEALQIVLSGLRTKLPVPVIVAQHLGPMVSRLDTILGRVSRHPVEWASDGERVRPGHVYLCPGRTLVRLEPDGTLTAQEFPRLSSRGLIDELFTSAVTSLGADVLALVLTGMGSDGAAGAHAVKRAGGTVIVQNEITAMAFAMSSAVIDAGDADLILSLGEIPRLLDRVVGEGSPLPTATVRASESVFGAGGEMGRRMSAVDWGTTALGPVDRWPAALRSTLGMALSNPVAMNLMWGPDLLQLYNDAYRDLIGDRHPAALGRSARETWADATDRFRLVLRQITESGKAMRYTDRPYVVNRAGHPEQVFATVAFSPVRDGNRVAGVLATLMDTTDQVRGARRLATLHWIATTTPGDQIPAADQAICQRLINILAMNPHDVPFALIYLLNSTATSAHLAAVTGLAGGSPAIDPLITQSRPGAWPLHAIMRDATARVIDDLPVRFPGLAAGPWPQPPGTALILPIRTSPTGAPTAILVAGVSSHAPLDADYRQFFELVAEQVGAALAAARAHRETQQRMAALTRLNHAKNEFIANVSHEFRTLLTTLLLPLEDELAGACTERRETSLVLYRGVLRMLRLADSLPAFSALEQGRGTIEDVEDLAGLTTEIITTVFHPTIQRAGLDLVVDCPPLGRAVQLDPQMWEKVVLNLLSNALKHTFTGTITVRLRPWPDHAELTVADTGVGINPDEIPHLFTRFHRIKDARARSHEGSGIGLALIRELVRLHRGNVRVRSEPGVGTAFTVWVPYSQPWRRSPGADPRERGAAAARFRRAFAEEAESWLASDEMSPDGTS